MIFQLAWRNIWRNPRRTVVISTAVVIGVWSMVFLGALMRGISDGMIRNGIAAMTGHIQIHRAGYRADPVIENSMVDTEIVESALDKSLPSGAWWTRRIRVNAVAANARHSAGVTLVGVEPDWEARVSFIGNAVTQGRYLSPDDPRGIIVGEALLDKFETRLGRKLIVMSQDTDKEIASRAFRIVGVFQAEMEATEKEFVFINLPAARKLVKLDGGCSEYAMILPDDKTVPNTIRVLKEKFPEDLEVVAWNELLPLLTAYLGIMDGFIAIWYVVVFVAMGFGIVNTTLMAVFERMREFGLMKALGMKPWWIVRDVLMESFILLLMGMVIGNVLGVASIQALSGGLNLTAFAEGAEYAGMSRIIFPSLYARDVFLANAVVFGLGLLISLYPAVKAARFTPVEAMARN